MKVRRQTLLQIAGLTLFSLVSACDQESADAFLEERPTRASLSVHPEFFCPGEVITAEWSGRTQRRSCGSTEPWSSCLRGNTIFSENGAPLIRMYGEDLVYAPPGLNGSGSVQTTADTEEILFTRRVDEVSVDSIGVTYHRGVSRLLANAERSDRVSFTRAYRLECNSGEMAVVLSDESSPLTRSSACLGISTVVGPSTGTTSVRAGGGGWSEVDGWDNQSPSSAGVGGYRPEDVEVDTAQMIDIPQLVADGARCGPDMSRPEYGDGTLVVEGGAVRFFLTCQAPEQLQNPEHQEACRTALTPTTDTIVLTQNLRPGGGGSPGGEPVEVMGSE